MPNVLQLAPSRWGIAMGIYTVAFISYSVTLAFYAAIFPRLAYNVRHIRELKERYDQGKIAADKYEQAEALEKSKISSLSMVRALLLRPSLVMLCCFRHLAPLVSSQYHCSH
jgi:Vacuole effluxer Atg22 like